jgi:mannose-6-phosphate isomerase
MYKLNCVVQTYAWGKRGGDSLVANLKAKHDRTFSIDPQKPYAELWMGTHSNGPSMIVCKEDDENRKESVRGRRIDEDLDFLFKVLSVNQALSIQAHPNKQLAKVLHAQQPSNYPDDNHKPEMLIALNDFEALCGFR